MKKVGLVLSGGGARGLAHVGAIKVLVENKFLLTISPAPQSVLLSAAFMRRQKM
jgi:predicted patatin/cPLA2 family phospholipase